MPTLNQTLRTSPLLVEATGQRHMQTMKFLHLGVLSTQTPTLTKDPTRMGMLHGSSGGCTIRRMPSVTLKEGAPAKERGEGDPAIRVRDLGSWPGAHVTELRTAHHILLLWYAKVLKKAQCESVETTIRKRRISLRGAYNGRPMSGGPIR